MRVIYTIGPSDLSPYAIIVSCYPEEKMKNTKYCYKAIYSYALDEMVEVLDGYYEPDKTIWA